MHSVNPNYDFVSYYTCSSWCDVFLVLQYKSRRQKHAIYDYTLHSKKQRKFTDVLDELDIQSNVYVYHIVKHSADLSDFRFITSGYYKDKNKSAF